MKVLLIGKAVFYSFACRSKDLQRRKALAKYMDSESKVLLGACWAGLQEKNLKDLSREFNGATIYGNLSPSNSFRFLWSGTFIGNVGRSFGKGDKDNECRVGLTAVVQMDSYTIETRIVRIDVRGNITITDYTISNYRKKRAQWAARHSEKFKPKDDDENN